MANFYSIPLEEMDAFLRSRRFQPVDLTYRNRPVKEWVYERPLPRQPNHFVRVYTGINRYGRSQNQSRGAGKDAIRVQVIYKVGDVETLVTQPKRVHRVTGWADNLDNRLSEIAQSLPQVVFDRRGEPMTLRRKNGKYFWGSRDYPRYKETRPFQAESAPLVGQTTEAPYEIKVYVPSTLLDQPISDSDFKSRIEETQEKLSELFGGFTTVGASGGYLSQQDGVISEPVIVVSSWATEEDYQSKLADLENFLKQKKTDWGQEVIGFEFENDFFMYPAFAAEEIRCCKECDKTTGLTTIQTGTYCFDCLPINLGADSDNQVIRFNGEMSEYADKNTDDNFTSMSNLAHISLPDYEESYYWTSADGNSRATVAYDEENGVILIPNFEVSLHMRGKKMAHKYLEELIDDAYLDGYSVQVIDVDNHAIGFWEKMQSQGLIEGWSKGSFAAENYVPKNEGVVAEAWIEGGELKGQTAVRIDYLKTPIGSRGLGRSEFENILTWAKKHDVDYIIIESESEAVGFWKKMGFEKVGGDGELITMTYPIKNQFAAEDNYEATYGLEQAKIRRRLKNKIKKQAIMGTKAGQWSARKSQELKRQYEAACEKKGLNAYKGKKTKSQDNLSKWSQQKWRTASGKKSSTTGEPYFPAKAVAALKDKGLYSKAKQQKKAATKAGKQNARYSDDIRAVVKNYRSETYEEATGVEFSEQNPEKIEADAPPDWRESIITIPQSDSFGYALYRKMSDLTYNQVWRVLELIDDLNRMSHHHAVTRFSSNYVEIWIYSHDSGLVEPKDYHWAEDFNDMIATVDWQMWESETEWEDVDWEKEKPVKDQNDWGEDVEWEAEDDWGSLRPETRPDFPTVDAQIASMLRNHSKVNVNGEQGCPRCGQEDLFYRESTGTGTKWYCYGCFYTEKTESQKSQKIVTLEKYGLKVRCPDCNEMIVAYNQASINSHRKKCGVSK